MTLDEVFQRELWFYYEELLKLLLFLPKPANSANSTLHINFFDSLCASFHLIRISDKTN